MDQISGNGVLPSQLGVSTSPLLPPLPTPAQGFYAPQPMVTQIAASLPQDVSLSAGAGEHVATLPTAMPSKEPRPSPATPVTDHTAAAVGLTSPARVDREPVVTVPSIPTILPGAAMIDLSALSMPSTVMESGAEKPSSLELLVVKPTSAPSSLELPVTKPTSTSTSSSLQLSVPEPTFVPSSLELLVTKPESEPSVMDLTADSALAQAPAPVPLCVPPAQTPTLPIPKIPAGNVTPLSIPPHVAKASGYDFDLAGSDKNSSLLAFNQQLQIQSLALQQLHPLHPFHIQQQHQQHHQQQHHQQHQQLQHQHQHQLQLLQQQQQVQQTQLQQNQNMMVAKLLATVPRPFDQGGGAINDIEPPQKQAVGENLSVVLDPNSAIARGINEMRMRSGGVIMLEISLSGLKDTWEKASEEPARFPVGLGYVLQFTISPSMLAGHYLLRVRLESLGLSTSPVKYKFEREKPRKRELEHDDDGNFTMSTGASAGPSSTTSKRRKQQGYHLPSDIEARNLGRTISSEELHFLISKIKTGAIEPMHRLKSPPVPHDVVRRLLDKIVSGSLTIVRNSTVSFVKDDCVLVACPKRLRSHVRFDIANFCAKVFPHALAYRLWCDPHFNMKDWQKLLRKPCCLFGYSGPKLGGWAHNHYVCANPFHYTLGVQKMTADFMSYAGDSIDTEAVAATAAAASYPSDDDTVAKMPMVKGIALDEFEWLIKQHRPGSLVGTEAKYARPDPSDVTRRLLDKIDLGSLTKRKGKQIQFEKKCVLIKCRRESRSSCRMDVNNLQRKAWPHALTYRMWRDQHFQLTAWQSLHSESCCKYGYNGPRHGGAGGWANDEYLCINPFHYHAVGDKKSVVDRLPKSSGVTDGISMTSEESSSTVDNPHRQRLKLTLSKDKVKIFEEVLLPKLEKLVQDGDLEPAKHFPNGTGLYNSNDPGVQNGIIVLVKGSVHVTSR